MSDNTRTIDISTGANKCFMDECNPQACQLAKRRMPQKVGGARRDRTDDLMLAKHALSQLSYGPLT